MTASKNKKSIPQSFDIEELSKNYPLFLSYYNFYLQKYNKADLSLKEGLSEIKMSNTSFYDKKKKGKGIPCYRQENEKSKIFFPIVCVALYKSKGFIKTED